MLEVETIYLVYSGLGDRHQQIVSGVTTNYTLDLNTGLTQVLADGTNTYLYGNGRIAQAGSTTEYFLGDALGSVRQLTDTAGAVTLTQSYAPYGETVSSVGNGASVYQFTGEIRDTNGLTYLRARYLDNSTGRFTQKDPSRLEANLYLYAAANPINRVDPSGLISRDEAERADVLVKTLKTYNIFFGADWGEYSSSSASKIPFVQQSCGWYDGEWKMSELLETYLGVTDLAVAMGGRDKFIQNIGRRFVVMKADTEARAYTYGNIIVVTNHHNNLKRFTVVHELAHAWDNHHHNLISVGMEKATGGYTGSRKDPTAHNEYCAKHDFRASGCNDDQYFYGGIPAYVSNNGHFDRREDFAYSVAAYVYLNEFHKEYITKTYIRDHKNLEYTVADFRNSKRWLYINAWMQATQ